MGGIDEYIEPYEINTEDIVELACALARINQMHELGEVAYDSDRLFNTGELELIRRALEIEKEEMTRETMVELYKRLRELRP